jgi:hypothetical protein
MRSSFAEEMIRSIQVTGIIVGMHLIGSAMLFGYVSGPLAALAAPLLGLFGWIFIFPELIGVGLQWVFYDPYPKPGFLKVTGYAMLSAIVGGGIVSILTPKEQGNEGEFWIAGFLAGASAAIFSFSCIHLIKSRESRIGSEQAGRGDGDKPPN